MKIGVISDIHGNLPALNAVYNHMPNSIDRIICVGDIIGYGPKPRECLDKINQTSDLTIKGNHEKALIQGESFNSTTAHYGLENAKKELYSDHYNWLENLPSQIRNNEMLMFHSHPDTQEHIYPEDIETVIMNLDEKYQIVVYGHTHIPVNNFYNQTLVVNPGSVGQPRDSDQRASYAVIDASQNNADIHRVEYDIQKTIQQLQDNGFPEESIERILDAN